MTKKNGQISIVVTPQIRKDFDGIVIRGSGGFQRVMQDVVEKVTASHTVVRFSPDEFRRVIKYATLYGNGGFQVKLKTLVAHWAGQNLDHLIEGE